MRNLKQKQTFKQAVVGSEGGAYSPTAYDEHRRMVNSETSNRPMGVLHINSRSTTKGRLNLAKVK